MNPLESTAAALAAMPDNPAAVRAEIRAGRYTGPTAGLASGWVHANVVLLPAADAADFAEFCRRNAQACPLFDQTAPGDFEPRAGAPGADLRTDVPRYRVFRHGVADPTEPTDVRHLWRDDLVGFLIGCSFTFERRSPPPVCRCGIWKWEPMCRCIAPIAPANRPAGSPVRWSSACAPIGPRQFDRVQAITSRFPRMHGGPIHVGEPEQLGIADLARPDFGDPVEIRAGEVPVFWACGVTSQLAVVGAVRSGDHPQPGLHADHRSGRVDDGRGPGQRNELNRVGQALA